MAYGDAHRIFLQGIMSKGILSYVETYDLLKIACNRLQSIESFSKFSFFFNLIFLFGFFSSRVKE